MNARHLATLIPWLVLAACGGKSAPDAAPATPPANAPVPTMAADIAGAPEPAVSPPAVVAGADIATGMSAEVGVAAAVAGDQFIVWTRSAKGYTSAWIAADGQDNGGSAVLATRDEVALFDGEDVWALQWHYAPFQELACEFVDNELPGAKVVLGPKRYYPWLAARALGTELPERTLLAPYDGDSYGDKAKDGEPPTYWGEHWGRTIEAVGGEGARLFLTDCDGGYGCGAHGETGCAFMPVTFGAAVPALDFPALEKEVAGLRKSVEAGWVDNDEINSEGINLEGVYFHHRGEEFEIGYQFVASCSYAGTDGSWSSYSQARTKFAPPVAGLGLHALPGPVRAYLRSQPGPQPRPDGSSAEAEAVSFGWSAVPASAKREALLAAFKDPATLAPPRPEDEAAGASEGANAKLAEGRKATKEKRYLDAIKAFDEAIAGSATLARAWSGRGYAKLLSGDLAGAKVDFDQALTLDATPKFQGAVHFNLGELALRNKDVVAAKAAFTKANQLAPSDAAKKQLERLKSP